MNTYTVSFDITVIGHGKRNPSVVVAAKDTRDAAILGLTRLSENGGFDPKTERLHSVTIV